MDEDQIWECTLTLKDGGLTFIIRSKDGGGTLNAGD